MFTIRNKSKGKVNSLNVEDDYTEGKEGADEDIQGEMQVEEDADSDSIDNEPNIRTGVVDEVMEGDKNEPDNEEMEEAMEGDKNEPDNEEMEKAMEGDTNELDNEEMEEVKDGVKNEPDNQQKDEVREPVICQFVDDSESDNESDNHD